MHPKAAALKQIEAIVRPEKLDDVTRALTELGHSGLTVTPVKGHGAQGGVRQMWRNKEYVVDLLPKVRIVAVVADADLDTVVQVIVSAARTGRIGDGKIFVSPVEDALRIRTGENGLAALVGGPDIRRAPPLTVLIDAEAS
jgi:nitrogen regulatory protein P-II 1